MWVGDDDTRPILLKDEGAGVMISAFQCCEFDFGLELNQDQLKKINEKRKGESYVDKDAAKLKRGQKKDDLTSSPFYVKFEYGAQNKGYWTYNHFVLQCREVFNCLKVLFP